MIVFDDGEFEIALLTYNRSEFVKIWLEKCYSSIAVRNICLSVYDSSTNDDTQTFIQNFTAEQKCKISYHRIDSSTIIGYKPMIPILQSKAKYLWVSGDSRYHDFDELDQCVFPNLKNDSADYIVFNVKNSYSIPDTMFEDFNEMLHYLFVPSTCIGLSIYRMSMFKSIRENQQLLDHYDQLFRQNYAFSWLGYFYNVFAEKNHKALLVNAAIKTILDLKKKQSWAVRFFGCWGDDLCQLIDNLPDRYSNKDIIPGEVWKIMKLDSFFTCVKARVYGDLDIRKYRELVSNGILNRITQKTARVKCIALMPKSVLRVVYFLYKITYQFLRRVKRLVVR